MTAVALDVHRDFCEVAIVEQGELRSGGRIETKPETLELFAQSLDVHDHVALEVTGNAWEIARIIEPRVARVIVVSPSDTGIRQARAKTDRLDARALAKLLWAGSSTRSGCPTSASARCGAGSRAGRSWCVRARAPRTRSTQCSCAASRGGRRRPICSASRAGAGFRSRSCRSPSARRSTPPCARLSSSTQRSRPSRR